MAPPEPGAGGPAGTWPAVVLVGCGVLALAGLLILVILRQRAAETRYRSLFGHIRSGVAVYEARNDGEDFVFIDLNRAAERIEGTPRQGVIGRSVLEVFPGVRELGLFEVFQRVWRTGTPEHHPAARYRDERIVGWRDNYVYRLPSGEVVAVYDDVTKEKQAEAALRDSEALLREAERISRVGGWAYNVATRRIRWTDEVYRIHDLPVGADIDLIATSLACYHPEDRPLVEGAFRRAVEEGRPYDLEARLTTVQGRSLWVRTTAWPVRENGRVVRVLGNIMDITDRRQTEDALRRERDFAGRLLETANAVILVLDAQCRVVQINRFGQELLGRTGDELRGQDWVETVIHPDDRAACRACCDALLAGQASAVLEGSVVGRGRQTIVVRWYAAPLRDSDGAVTGILGIGHDITELRQAEEQFLQAQKMEAVGRLAGGVAHDFNNQLTIILGYADVLLKDLPADSPWHQPLGHIRHAAQQAVALTSQLLTFSRRQRLHARVMNLNDVLHQVAGPLRHMIGEDIELSVRPGPGLANTRADPVLVQQAVLNLASNARDAMPTGGRLTIETANADLDGRYVEQHPDASPGPHVVLCVTDTGVGMDDETLARAFEPFFSTKPVGEGTGLGLAMVYGFARQSGGHVDVESAPGHGTSVRVYLPRVDEPVEGGAGASPPALPRPGTETILVVEDEESVRALVARVLGRAGYVVIEAATAAQAMAVIEDPGRWVHLVLSDVVMPGGSGTNMAEHIRETRPDVPVLLMTGYAETGLAVRGEMPFGEGFLAKPFLPADLLNAVRQTLDAAAARPAGGASTGETAG